MFEAGVFPCSLAFGYLSADNLFNLPLAFSWGLFTLNEGEFHENTELYTVFIRY